MLIARKASPHDYMEVFNACWLRVRETELKNPALVINDHRKYFKTVVTNYIKNPRLKEDQQPEWFTSDMKLCSADVIQWYRKRTGNERDDFYREILEITLTCKNKNDAIRMLGMHRTTFFDHFNEAKKRLKNDLLSIRNIPDPDGDLMV